MSAVSPLPITPPPGVVVTETLRVSQGRFVPPFEKLRFVKQRVQKIGGNIRVTSTAMSGTPRALRCWRDFLANQYAASGTYRKLYAFDSSWVLNDITPFSSTGSLNRGAIVARGAITAGSGYTTPGTYNNVALTGGSGSGATANITVSGGGVTAVTIVTKGTFYAAGDALSCSAGSIGGGGTGFSVAVATIGVFTTTSGSALVSVADQSHGRAPGDTSVFAGAAVFNGVTMTGAFIVATVEDSNNYTVTAAQTASASGIGGGNSVTFQYEIPVGTELGAYGQGYGVGPYGLGTYGTARSSSTIYYEPRVWSLDTFGYYLLAAYNGGSLWAFDPTQAAPWGRALSTIGGYAIGSPSDIRAFFVTPERVVVTLCDAMVINACSQNDPTDWTPSTTNTAFSRTLQEGTKLVGGRVLAPYLSLIWSDAALYLLQYTGSQFVYNSSLAGKDCGLISPNAAITVDGVAYWMGPDNFYGYNGAVNPLPNVEDIRKYVFDAVPVTLAYQCAAIYVPKYHEIWFFYPASASATNPTNYVIYHINDACWSIGTADFYSSSGVTAARASGHHFSQGDTSPLMAGTDGYIYNHDYIGDTYNDNGNALTWLLTLAPYALSEGLTNLDVEGIVWDFKDQSGDIEATVDMWDRLTDAEPMDTQTQTVPDTLAGLTDYRVGGRYAGLTLTSSALGNYMRWGKPAAFAKTAGTRR